MTLSLKDIETYNESARKTADESVHANCSYPDYCVIADAANLALTLVAWALKARQEIQDHGYCRCEPEASFIRLDGTLAFEVCPRCKLLEELTP